MLRQRTYKFEPINMNKYRGEWIAFVAGKIAAHGKVLKNVVKQAKKIGKDPIIDKVPEQETLIA
ncbi:MAG: DUF5678 domain-containing protein [Candidatus Omnitrophota bacterium]